MPPTFQSLIELHESLASLFVEHQVALTEMNLPRAGELLDRFTREIHAHIRHEEDVLLPVWEERVPPSRLATGEIFRGEHRKVEAHLERFAERLAAIRAGGPDSRRQVVELIEEHHIFKELLRHHDERERDFLYTGLDETCTPEERSRMLQPAEAAC